MNLVTINIPQDYSITEVLEFAAEIPAVFGETQVNDAVMFKTQGDPSETIAKIQDRFPAITNELINSSSVIDINDYPAEL